MRMRSKLVGLATASMMIGVLLLTSCKMSLSSQGTSESSTKATKPYGSLTIALEFKMESLDPQLITTSTHRNIGAAVLEDLVTLNFNAELTPEIAERWEISPDGKTHTFYIRKGVKFHNGDDLTGADVKFSLERILAPETTNTDAAIWRAAIAGVDLKDDYTVVMRMKTPQFELLKGFGLEGTDAVVPKKYIEEKGVDYFRSHPIGSGPFRVVKWETGSRVELEAVEDHWRVVPRFKNVTLLPLLEESVSVAMLKTGELDIAPVASDSVAGLKAAGLRIFSYDGGGQHATWLFYDMEHPEKYALGDVRVRHAMSLGMNRKEMGDKVFGGYAEPSVVYFYAPKTGPLFDSNVLKPDSFDPEQAKKLLAEAGHASGFDMKYYDKLPGTIESMVNQAIAGYWRKIGINAQVVPMEWTTLRAKLSPKQLPEVWPGAFGAIGGGALRFERMVTTYHSTKSSFKNVKNARLDELIDKVPLTVDPVEKKKLAVEAALLAKNDYGILADLDIQTVMALGPKVGELAPIKGVTGLGAVYETITHSK